MATYEDFREAVVALRNAPGHITKSEVDALLRRFPATPERDDYADGTYDPEHYA